MVPGRWLHRLAKFFVPPHLYEQIVEAQLADFQHEWSQARSRESRGVILIRGYCAFWRAMVWCAMGGCGSEADDRRALFRTLGSAIVATVAAVVLLLIPPLSWSTALPPDRQAALIVVYGIPQALPLAVPIGMMVGMLVGLGRRLVSRRLRCAVLIVAIACSLGSFVTLAWVMPRANQAFRVAVAGPGDYPRKGENELTLGELSREISALRRQGLASRGLQSTYHLRWSLSCATFMLTLFGLSTTRRRMTARVGLTVAACAGYYVLLTAGNLRFADGVVGVWLAAVPAFIAAWLPNLFVLTLVIALRTRRGPAEAGH